MLAILVDNKPKIYKNVYYTKDIDTGKLGDDTCVLAGHTFSDLIEYDSNEYTVFTGFVTDYCKSLKLIILNDGKSLPRGSTIVNCFKTVDFWRLAPWCNSSNVMHYFKTMHHNGWIYYAVNHKMEHCLHYFTEPYQTQFMCNMMHIHNRIYVDIAGLINIVMTYTSTMEVAINDLIERMGKLDDRLRALEQKK